MGEVIMDFLKLLIELLKKIFQNGSNNKTATTIYAVNDEITYGTKYQYHCRLMDVETKKPITGENVTINISGKNYVKRTDENGEAFLNINLNPGYYPVKCSYDGNNNYEACSTDSTLSIIKVKKDTVLTADNQSKEFKQDYNFKAHLTVKTDGKDLKGQNVMLSVNGKSYPRTTDDKGMVYLPIHLNVGDYSIVCKYDGNDDYNASTCTARMTVKKDTVETVASTVKQTKYTADKNGCYWNPRYLTGGEEKQNNGYYCADVSIMQCVYELYGKDLSQREIASFAGTTTSGTGHSGINQAISKLNSKYGLNMSIEWKNFSTVGWDELAQICRNPDKAFICHHMWHSFDGSDSGGHYTTFAAICPKSKTCQEIYSLSGPTLVKRTFSYMEKCMNEINQPSIGIISKKADSGSSKPSTSTTNNNNNGIKAVFVNNSDMDKVDLNNLHGKGYNTIFLAHVSLQKRTQKEVTGWIQKANKKGIKVYIWYTTYYNGENIVAANTKEADSRIQTAITYGKIKEVSGIILDYCRYNSKTHNDNIMNAITSNIDKVKKGTNKPVGACTMFENIDTLKSYYHQDIRNWNCDYILPMSYKYNYGYQDAKMTALGSTFKQNIKGKLVPIFQNYKGDNDVTDIGVKQLNHDVALIKADGHAVFRYGTGAL